MMRKGVLLLAVSGLLLWIVIQKPNQSQSLESKGIRQDKEIITTVTKKSEELKKKTEQKQPKESIDLTLTSEQEHRLDLLKEEMATPVYSDDLYIEASVHSDLLMHCEMFNAGFIRTDLKGKIKNKSWELAYKKHCDSERKKRTQLLIRLNSPESFDWVPTTSRTGQLYKKMASLPYDQNEQAAVAFTHFALHSQKAHLLFLASRSEGPKKAFNYLKWLGTNNKKYNGQIIGLAYEQLICELDPEGLCGPNSSLMAQNCWQTPNDCGIPYSQWYEKNHMPGMKKDVAIVVEKLKAYSRGEEIE